VLDDFAEMSRANFLKRLIATVLVFGVGIIGTVGLAWTYVTPISRVVDAARRVAAGSLEQRLPEKRRDEIGELNRSFNEMVERLREKAELEARLHQAERLSAVAHLASGIAHEVRNPLNLINLSIDHMRARFAPAGAEERAEFTRLAEHIKKEVHRLNQMIETFLKYGKPLKLSRQPADLRTLVDEVLEVAARQTAAASVRVSRDYAAQLPTAWVDVAHLKTCFLNLVLNAVQAMPKGGELRVAVHGAPDDATAPDGRRVVLTFDDTGTGIAPADLPKIFEPYFTTKEVGIGLGLALTKKIIEEHGGQIALSSEPGTGTRARLVLPVGAPAA
jgi:signal transduction histidine kinase